MSETCLERRETRPAPVLRPAIVRDPDGNDVGLMSPPEPARRFTPGP